MKKRLGFVTNSSSSSFVIQLSDLTKEQISTILNPYDKSIELGLYREEDDIFSMMYCSPRSWSIVVKDDELVGYTFMDNFDFPALLEAIGVDISKVELDRPGSGGIGLQLAIDHGVDVFGK